METTEIIKAVSEPAIRLIDAVRQAIGKAYEPRHIRKIADANAYQIKVIGEALRDNGDLPIVYTKDQGVSADMSDFDSLIKRAEKRLAYQEIQKQENIEEVLDTAYELLQGQESMVEGEISREWMHRFIDSAGDISTEEMQKLWAKVLAGQVINPTSFSLRTLECLKNLEKNEAELFEEICQVVISHKFLLNDKEFLSKHSIVYDQILQLDESGLLNSSPTSVYNVEVLRNPGILVDFGEYILLGRAESFQHFTIMSFPLTLAGKELSQVVKKEMSIETIKEICSIAQVKNPNIKCSLHKIKLRSGENVEYNQEEISFLSESFG